MKLLLVEDEANMAEALSELLRQEKYDVDVRRDGISGEDALLSGVYDAAVLDVMLPGKSGFEIVRTARDRGVRTPVLMLTAKSALDDKVTGLDSGADDYMTKPFLPRELSARLRALCRRSVAAAPDGTLSFGDVSLDPCAYLLRCTATGQSVALGEKEYRLLECLMANAGRVLSREQLAEKVWGYDCEAEYNNVEVYLSFTRKKLSFVGSKVEIRALRGLGYRMKVRDVS